MKNIVGQKFEIPQAIRERQYSSFARELLYPDIDAMNRWLTLQYVCEYHCGWWIENGVLCVMHSVRWEDGYA